MNGQVIRWERRGNKILLCAPNYGMVSDPHKAIATAVAASNTHSIVMSFDIAAFGVEEAAVIDVTRLYANDGELGPHKGAADPSRSFNERISAFPENVEAEATYTYVGGVPSMPGVVPMVQSGPRRMKSFALAKQD